MTAAGLQPLNRPDMRMPQSAWWSAFSHDGRRLYTCGGHPHIWVWDMRAFRLAGHEATVCDNAARALELVKSEAFDMMLSDVVMPGKDGLSLLEDLRKALGW